MRTDKPIGALLLLWADALGELRGGDTGYASAVILAVFVAGVWLLRGGLRGKMIGADRKFDGHKRTVNRPLPSGAVCYSAQPVCGAGAAGVSVGAYANAMTILLSVAALALASGLSFMKRYTHLPQVASRWLVNPHGVRRGG